MEKRKVETPNVPFVGAFSLGVALSYYSPTFCEILLEIGGELTLGFS